jgi:hypothetical protein
MSFSAILGSTYEGSLSSTYSPNKPPASSAELVAVDVLVSSKGPRVLAATRYSAPRASLASLQTRTSTALKEMEAGAVDIKCLPSLMQVINYLCVYLKIDQTTSYADLPESMVEPVLLTPPNIHLLNKTINLLLDGLESAAIQDSENNLNGSVTKTAQRCRAQLSLLRPNLPESISVPDYLNSKDLELERYLMTYVKETVISKLKESCKDFTEEILEHFLEDMFNQMNENGMTRLDMFYLASQTENKILYYTSLKMILTQKLDSKIYVYCDNPKTKLNRVPKEDWQTFSEAVNNSRHGHSKSLQRYKIPELPGEKGVISFYEITQGEFLGSYGGILEHVKNPSCFSSYLCDFGIKTSLAIQGLKDGTQTDTPYAQVAFMNHSDTANVTAVPIIICSKDLPNKFDIENTESFIEAVDKGWITPRIFFLANQDIAPGTPLCINYGENFFENSEGDSEEVNLKSFYSLTSIFPSTLLEAHEKSFKGSADSFVLKHLNKEEFPPLKEDLDESWATTPNHLIPIAYRSFDSNTNILPDSPIIKKTKNGHWNIGESPLRYIPTVAPGASFSWKGKAYQPNLKPYINAKNELSYQTTCKIAVGEPLILCQSTCYVDFVKGKVQFHLIKEGEAAHSCEMDEGSLDVKNTPQFIPLERAENLPPKVKYSGAKRKQPDEAKTRLDPNQMEDDEVEKKSKSVTKLSIASVEKGVKKRRSEPSIKKVTLSDIEKTVDQIKITPVIGERFFLFNTLQEQLTSFSKGGFSNKDKDFKSVKKIIYRATRYLNNNESLSKDLSTTCREIRKNSVFTSSNMDSLSENVDLFLGVYQNFYNRPRK